MQLTAVITHAAGRIGLYGPRGDYQLIVDHMEPAGQGLLQRRFDKLKARLAAEGLFDAAAGIVAALDFANRHGACDLLILTRKTRGLGSMALT